MLRPARTIAETVAQEITRAIKEQRLLPGQRLVEADLTVEYGVSRTPLREALSRLAALGIVEVEPHRGASVPILSDAELAQMLAVRSSLEALAARLAAQSTDRVARNNLARIVDDFPEDERIDKAGNARFHEAIMYMSGNAQLISSLEPLYVREFFLRANRWHLSRLEEHAQTEQHRSLARAILDREPEEAERFARLHVSYNEQLIRSGPRSAPAPSLV